ncbi:hypothetical protein V6N13_052155 [Hibiscus sabdariffa]
MDLERAVAALVEVVGGYNVRVLDPHGTILDSFSPMNRAYDGSHFGFVVMLLETEVVWVQDRLDRHWIYGSCMRVSIAKHGTRDWYWLYKRGDGDVATSDGRIAS